MKNNKPNRVNWNSRTKIVLPILFAVFIPFMGQNKYIVSYECFEDGGCRTEYSDGSWVGRCVYPELGCDGVVRGDVQ